MVPETVGTWGWVLHRSTRWLFRFRFAPTME